MIFILVHDVCIDNCNTYRACELNLLHEKGLKELSVNGT